MARERKFSTDELFQLTKKYLLELGYEGFTFSHLAEQLGVSRGTIYKYYENKDELLTDYMLYEMNLFLAELKEIDGQVGFQVKFDFLLDLILKNTSVQQMIEIGLRIPANSTKKVAHNKRQLEQSHLHMYQCLESFVQLGKNEGILKQDIPNPLILGYIFQSVAIPNHFEISHAEWTHWIKEVIRHGMFQVH